LKKLFKQIIKHGSEDNETKPMNAL